MTAPSPPAGNMPGEPWVAIVDDHPSVRKALARALRIEGICVRTFGAADEYLAASALDGAPSCLVLDVHLGADTMSGLDLHTFITQTQANVHVILMTAHDEVPSAELARRVGPDQYLRKPFHTDAFVSLIRRALRSGV